MVEGKRPRTFVVLVEDVPGVLDRVASLFRRRAYNIESLSVGHTDREGVSHVTVVIDADDRVAALVEANLYKVAAVLGQLELQHFGFGFDVLGIGLGPRGASFWIAQPT